jgi:uncharacterized protein (TIGR03000 family)
MKRFTLWMAAALACITLVTDVAEAQILRGRLFGRRRNRDAEYTYSDSGSSTYTIQDPSYSTRGRRSMYPQTTAEPVPAPRSVREQTTTTGGAVLDFVVPADAQIWVDGKLIERKGERYRYQSGPITAGQKQSFEVRAQWNDDGRVVTQTRTVSAGSGGNMKVDFTKPAPAK